MTMTGPDAFQARNTEMTERMANDPRVREATRAWMHAVLPYEYHYHFSWLGVPIIQFPSDIVAMQELMWRLQPDLIIETGIARGGSLVFYASMLELSGGDGRVVGVDVDIREHTRNAITHHPLRHRIEMIEGSSVEGATVERVSQLAQGRQRVVVSLDSNHTHAHVAAELQCYARFVTSGSYLIVFDTVIEELADEFHAGRPWRRGNSPSTAVREFLAANADFSVDRTFEHKALVTVAPDGFLLRR